LFDITSYNKWLQTGRLGRRFWYFRSLSSTNRYLQQTDGVRLSDGLVCLTDYQTKGRGQFGRSWDSTDGENLTFSMVFRPTSDVSLQLISLTAMLAMNETIKNTISCDSKIKWPNDLIVSGKKVAGMLTECRYNGKKRDRILVGLGVNVNQTQFSTSIQRAAISLKQVSGGQPVDRSLLLAMFLNRLEPYYSSALDGDMELIRSINRNIRGYGQWVSIYVDGVREQTPVKILGINEFGCLVVLTANDEVKTYTYQQIRIEDC